MSMISTRVNALTARTASAATSGEAFATLFMRHRRVYPLRGLFLSFVALSFPLRFSPSPLPLPSSSGPGHRAAWR